MSLVVIWIMQALGWALSLLGYERAVGLGSALGRFVFHVVRIRRGVVEDNLRHAFPEKSDAERKALAAACYAQLGRIFTEILISPRMTDEQLLERVRFVGIEPLDALFAEGQGAIVCLAHLGNWELLGLAAGRRGYVFHAITKRLKGKLNERLHAARRRVFNELPPKGSFNQGLEVLAKGESLALIVDQHTPGARAVVVDFFGRAAAATPSPALFALRSGAPVWCMWMTLADDGVYDVRFRGPFPVPEADTFDERLRLHTQAIAKDLEEVVREYPSQWFWVHRRWKVKQAGEATPASAGEAT